MKKFALALVAVVVVAVAALWAFWPQVRLWQMQQALDRMLIPAIKEQYRAAYGREPVIAHQGLTADGGAFVTKDFNLSLPGKPEINFKVKDLRLDKVDLSLLGELKTCDLKLGPVEAEIKGLEVGDKPMEFTATLEAVEANGLSISDGGMRIRLARKSARGLRLTSPSLPAPVNISLIEAKDYDLTAGPQWKSSQGSLGLLTVKTDNGVTVGMQGLTFSGDTPTWQNGNAYFDQVKAQVRGLAVSLPDMPGPEPALGIAEMNMVLSRKPQRAADRVEIKGVNWRERPDDKVHQVFKDLGYDQPRLDVVYDYVFDQEAKTFDCKQLTLALDKAGSLTFSFLLKNMAMDLSGDAARNLAALRAAKPAKLSLRYDDASLMDKLLALGAQKDGMETEAFRAKLMQELPAMPGAMGPEPALKSFVQKPGSLCLEVTPRQELSLEEYTVLGPAILAVLEWKLDNCGN